MLQNRPLRYLVGVFTVLLLLCGWSVLAGDGDGDSKATRSSLAGAKLGSVHGTVVAELDGESIRLPDVSLYLENTSADVRSDVVTSDLDGRFRLLRRPSGTYRLCWFATGWEAGCRPQRITVKAGEEVHLDTISIEPHIVRRDGEITLGVVKGTVSMANGSPAWFRSEFFGVEHIATISAFDRLGKKLTRAVTPNRAGEFVLAGVPRTGVSLKARLAGTTSENKLEATDLDLGGSSWRNVKLPNNPPEILSIAAFQGDRKVRNVAAGDVVEVVALTHDPDQSDLRYEWKTYDDGSTLTETDEPGVVRWTLPNRSGPQTLFLLVSDGKGGYDQGQMAMSVGIEGTVFSGQVADQTGQALAGVTVEVGGVETLTDAAGLFYLEAQASERYVLNFTREGIVPGSFVYSGGRAGFTWTVLTAASQALLDPTQESTLADGSGAEVSIPANSLVNAAGEAPAGLVLAYLTYLDPSVSPLPGDNSAINSLGDVVALDSAGALDVSFWDESGTRFDLAPGTTASVTIPIYEGRPDDDLPPTIDSWWYNPASGYWEETSPAVKIGNAYTFTVDHFSTYNADWQFNNPACMQIIVDQSTLHLPMWLLVIRESTNQFFAFALDDTYNLIYNMAPNETVTLAPFDSQLRLIRDALQTGVNTGGTVQPLPPYPYNGCQPATLTANVPNWAGGPVNSAFLIFKGASSQQQAQGYYNGIDPNSVRTTLGGFWAANGWNQIGESNNEAETAYHNWIDLGFGREMHCSQTGAKVACYVTNYTTDSVNKLPTRDPLNADITAVAADESHPFHQQYRNIYGYGTVAMEYSPIDCQPPNPCPVQPIVKFYVYDGRAASSVRVDAARLDKFGPKFIPNLCLNCHGGSYFPVDPQNPTAAELNMGATFLPFDLMNFTYSGFRDRTGLTAAEELEYKNLNLYVQASSPTPSINTLVNGWYGSANPNVQDSSFIPDASPASNSWRFTAARRELYLGAVAPACRACHTAQEFVRSDITWATHEQFRIKKNSIKSLVCGSSKYMPHAFFTYQDFWTTNNPNYLGFYKPGALEDWLKLEIGPSEICQ